MENLKTYLYQCYGIISKLDTHENTVDSIQHFKIYLDIWILATVSEELTKQRSDKNAPFTSTFIVLRDFHEPTIKLKTTSSSQIFYFYLNHFLKIKSLEKFSLKFLH